MYQNEIKQDENGQNMFDRQCLLYNVTNNNEKMFFACISEPAPASPDG